LILFYKLFCAVEMAGDTKKGVARDVAGAGADVCIAGGAIYNSANPRETAGRILAEELQAMIK